MLWWCLAILEAPSLAKETAFILPKYWKGRVPFVQKKKMELISQICSSFRSVWTSKSYPVRGCLFPIPNLSKWPHASMPFFSLDTPPMVSPQYWWGGSSLACLHLLACVSWNEAHSLKSQKLFHEQEKSINSLNIPFYLSFLHFWLRDLTPKYITFQCVATLFQLSFILFLNQQILLQGALTTGLTIKASSTLSLLSSETLVDMVLFSLKLR